MAYPFGVFAGNALIIPLGPPHRKNLPAGYLLYYLPSSKPSMPVKFQTRAYEIRIIPACNSDYMGMQSEVHAHKKYVHPNQLGINTIRNLSFPAFLPEAYCMDFLFPGAGFILRPALVFPPYRPHI